MVLPILGLSNIGQNTKGPNFINMMDKLIWPLDIIWANKQGAMALEYKKAPATIMVYCNAGFKFNAPKLAKCGVNEKNAS